MSASEEIESSTPARRPRRRSFVIISVLLGCVIGLLVAEAGLRIVGYSSPEFYQPDAERGYALIPNMKGTYSKEGRSSVSINREGFRDVDHDIAKPPGTFRIAVIGDSYVEALQVEQDEIFTNYMRDKLAKCGHKVEVLNFGVSGYGTAQEIITVRDFAMKYSPDVVMLMMTTNNDITDNSRYFKRLPIPYVAGGGIDESFRDDQAFRAKSSTFATLGRVVKNDLRIVQAIGAISTALKYRWNQWHWSQPVAAGTATEVVADIGTDNEVYREPATEEWKEAWSTTESALSILKDEVERKGSKLIVVTGSNGVQVLPDPALREQFAQRIGVSDLTYPDRRISDYCTGRGIPVITLTPRLAEAAERERVYLHGFGDDLGSGHWNASGHRVAGQVIGAELCSMLPQ